MKSTSRGLIRQPNESYFTPVSLTRDFLAKEYFQRVFDPCAGAGHILDACAEAGIPASGTDIDPGRADIPRDDFLVGNKIIRDADYVSNPPFGPGGRTAVAFIKASLDHTRAYGRKVAMLLHEDFDSSKTRASLFRDNPAFAGKYVLLQRIYWANFVATERPSTNHAWYVWSWAGAPHDEKFLRYLSASDGRDWR